MGRTIREEPVVELGDEKNEAAAENSVRMRKRFMEVDRCAVRMPAGLLTMCAWCKKVRDDRGYWKRAETFKVYIYEHSYGRITHGICPDCAGKVIEELEVC
jgi:hypothetical protein